VCCFFFQAEDGIRDRNVTGVQTCALPISAARNLLAWASGQERTPFTPVPYFWSDQYKMKVQLLGQGAPADEVTFVHGSPEDRKFVAFFGRDGMLTAVLGLRSTPRTMRYRD